MQELLLNPEVANSIITETVSTTTEEIPQLTKKKENKKCDLKNPSKVSIKDQEYSKQKNEEENENVKYIPLERNRDVELTKNISGILKRSGVLSNSKSNDKFIDIPNSEIGKSTINPNIEKTKEINDKKRKYIRKKEGENENIKKYKEEPLIIKEDKIIEGKMNKENVCVKKIYNHKNGSHFKSNSSSSIPSIKSFKLLDQILASQSINKVNLKNSRIINLLKSNVVSKQQENDKSTKKVCMKKHIEKNKTIKIKNQVISSVTTKSKRGNNRSINKKVDKNTNITERNKNDTNIKIDNAFDRVKSLIDKYIDNGKIKEDTYKLLEQQILNSPNALKIIEEIEFLNKDSKVYMLKELEKKKKKESKNSLEKNVKEGSELSELSEISEEEHNTSTEQRINFTTFEIQNILINVIKALGMISEKWKLKKQGIYFWIHMKCIQHGKEEDLQFYIKLFNIVFKIMTTKNIYYQTNDINKIHMLFEELQMYDFGNIVDELLKKLNKFAKVKSSQFNLLENNEDIIETNKSLLFYKEEKDELLRKGNFYDYLLNITKEAYQSIKDDDIQKESFSKMMMNYTDMSFNKIFDMYINKTKLL